MAKGTDPQLERAIQEVQRLLKEKPAPKPARPAYEKRVPREVGARNPASTPRWSPGS